MASFQGSFGRGSISFVKHSLPSRRPAIPEPGHSAIYFQSKCSNASLHWTRKVRLYFDREAKFTSVSLENIGKCCQRMASKTTEASCPLQEANTARASAPPSLQAEVPPRQPYSLHTGTGWTGQHFDFIFVGTEPVACRFTPG